MMKKALVVLLTLTLCVCAMLLCGSAMAEGPMYSVNIADFGSKVVPYVTSFELSNASGTEVSSNAIGARAGERVMIRITPSENCNVDSIKYSYREEEYGIQQEECRLNMADSGTIMTYFDMPPANVTVNITMSREGDAVYLVEGSFELCSGTISDGTRTGTSISAKPGSTLTITAVPAEGYSVGSMSYMTYQNPTPKAIDFTVDESGKATGTLVMPEDKVYISVSCGLYYISYNEGSQSLPEYEYLKNSSANWYDLNDQGESKGWYVARGNVTLSSNTTLRVTGSVHLILCDGAKLTAGDGVYIRKGSSLSIYGQTKGTGKLIAKPDNGPGIGGMADTVGGSLYIHGGVIEAEGGTNAAGIGGGNHASGYENIVIYGGRVTAKGGSSGAGIGKGQQNSPGDCGEIIIFGGEVNASSTKYGAGIGGGEDRDGGTIIIRGGTVKATGGHDGAGIGGGEGGSGGRITISGGTVTATGGSFGAGIGGGEHGSGGTIVISGGANVEADGGYEAAGIGGGKKGSGGSIIIRGGTVHASGSYEGDPNPSDSQMDAIGIGGGAAIGGGEKGEAGTISISGGEVHANASYTEMGGAAIGAGSERGGGSISISGGTIYASGHSGAAIGAGAYALCSMTINISGGSIDHAISADGAGIGAGYSGDFTGKISISGGTVNARGRTGGAGIGAGLESENDNPGVNGGECKGTIEITGGTVTATADEDSQQAQAIGHGGDGDDEGTLKLGDGVRVTSGGASSGSGAALQDAGKRIGACRNRYTKIETCDAHEVRSDEDHPYGIYPYQISEESHIGTCSWCNLVMPAEAHISEKGVCKVCGYNTNAVTVTFLPGDDRTEGEMASVDYPIDSTIIIPNCAYTLTGYEFNGWQLSITEPGSTEQDSTATVLAAGAEYKVADSIILTALWRNNWSDLQGEIDLAENGDVIQLKGETVASPYDGALTIPAGKSVVLDLNGCTLSRGLTGPAKNGQVIVNNGGLRIMDSAGGGVITGGWGAAGSNGGAILNRRNMTLESGTISGNRTEGSGGAVYNEETAIFDLTGGSVEGNECGQDGGAIMDYGTLNLSGTTITGNTSGRNGGGIWSMGALNISGGAITGNTAANKGGGIFTTGGTAFDGSRLRLSGSAVITGNTSTALGVNNVHYDTIHMYITNVGSFDEGALIGVSCSRVPTESESVCIVYGVGGWVPQIVSDRSEYEFIFVPERWQLHLAVATEYTVAVAEGIQHGTVNADAESCRAGGVVTLTVTPEEDYVLAGLTVTPESGEAKRILPDAEGAYRFTMPAANVTVSAEFVGNQTSAAVQLIWDDQNNEAGKRPETVTATLLDLGEFVRSAQLNVGTEWKSTQTGLPMDHNGELAGYTWTILEEDMPAGYTMSVETEGELTTLILRTAYPVIIAESEHGTVRADRVAASERETVTLTPEPDQGYALKTLTCSAGDVTLSPDFDEEAGTYSFTMPAREVTVTAVFEEKPSDWQTLQALIDGAQAGDTITLTQDYTGRAGDVSLLVADEKKITIDLNSHTIDGGDSGTRVFTVNGGELTIEGNGSVTGGLTESSVGGAFFVKSGGSLTLNGGSISGNTAYNGGGAVAVTNGTFILNGGRIEGNESSSHGGAVYAQGGTIVLNGGAIRSNKAEDNGGGLWAGQGSAVRITGGEIDSNIAELGEDVYLNGVGMAVSGSPKIGEAYVSGPVITVDGPLDPSAMIGVTCSNSAARKGAVLTGGLSGNGGLANFTSTKKAYVTELNDDGELVLAAGLTVTLDLNDGNPESFREIHVVSGNPAERPENPVREGYVFLGWQLNEEDYDFATPVTEEITLVAQWMPVFGTPDFILPEEVKAIEESAFEGARMSVVFIPDGCESIGNNAFKDCLNLTRIRVPAGCTLGENVFLNCERVFVFGTPGEDSADGAEGLTAEAYCRSHDNCAFVPIE